MEIVWRQVKAVGRMGNTVFFCEVPAEAEERVEHRVYITYHNLVATFR